MTDSVRFGPFELFPGERRLTKNGTEVDIGGRALDILVALVRRAGEVVDSRELIDLVWPNLHVEEANLRVNIGVLRRALGYGDGQARYVVNVRGRGYSFVGDLQGGERSFKAEEAAAVRVFALPPHFERIVGRAEVITAVSAQLARTRFVTLVGPGGIGKTTVAVAVGHRARQSADADVCFVDLGALTDRSQIVGALANVLGLAVEGDALATLIGHLRERRMLVILDSCEHLVDAIADLAERCVRDAPQIRILSTSREPLRAEGEHVHHLASLAFPDRETPLTAAEALQFPAIQLLVERATAAHQHFHLVDDEAQLAAELCRRLDGLALAIELAAARIASVGVRETAASLDSELALRWPGRRTAVPRHQTLQAMLDWSYSILTGSEQAVFRRLAVFVGPFSSAAARAIAIDAEISEADVIESLANLAAKSLVATGASFPETPYRLLDTTRAYARAKLMAAEEFDAVALKHARLMIELLERDAADKDHEAGSVLAVRTQIGNIRAALAWSFSAAGAPDTAVVLTAAAAPLLLELTLWGECERRTAAALAIEDCKADPRRNLDLLLAHAQSLLLLERHGPTVRDGFRDAADLARQLGEPLLEARALLGLHRYFGRNEDYAETLVIADRMRGIAVESRIGEAEILADLALGISHHFLGQQDLACSNMARGLQRAPRTSQMSTWLSVGSATIPTTICLARSLWLHGLPDQALAKARECRDQAEQLKLAGGPGDAATWVIQVYFWAGDWASAEEMTDDLQALDPHDSQSQSHGLSLSLRGELATRRGDAAFGVPLLRERLERLRAAGRYSLMPTIAYVEGLMALTQFDEAAEILDQAIELSRDHSHLLYMPELLRLRGEIAVERDPWAAEVLFKSALDLAAQQRAASWELRATISLSRLHLREGGGGEALAPLAEVVGRFTEGMATHDLVVARRMIETRQQFA